MGAKQIFHLEAFVAKYMRLYERYVLHFDKVGLKLTIDVATPWVSISIRHKRQFACLVRLQGKRS